MPHALHGIGRLTERRRFGEAFLPRQVMRLTPGGDQGVDTRLDTGGHVGLAEVAGVGQEPPTSPNASGKAPSVSTIGAICCLSLAAWLSPVATTSIVSVSTAAWAL